MVADETLVLVMAIVPAEALATVLKVAVMATLTEDADAVPTAAVL